MSNKERRLVIGMLNTARQSFAHKDHDGRCSAAVLAQWIGVRPSSRSLATAVRLGGDGGQLSDHRRVDATDEDVVPRCERGERIVSDLRSVD